MADRTELAFLKNALSARLLDPQEQTALENLVFQRLLAGNLQIDVNGQITGGGLQTGPGSGPPSLVALLDGTMAAPSLSFLNEPGTGRYRAGPGDVGESVLGLRVLDWSATRLQLTNINLSFANDNVNDIGAVGANRPRDLFLGRNAAVGGTLSATGATTLGGTLAVGGTTTDSGALLFSPDSTYDIGASGATRPRNLFLGNNAVVGGTLNVTGMTVIGGTLTLTVPLPGSSGGTGTAYFTVVGPTAPRTYTFPDANATVLTTNAAVTVPQGGTGATSLAAHGTVIGEGTSAVTTALPGVAGQVLTSTGPSTDPIFQAAVPSYEEASWTPTITADGSASGQTYSSQQGHYVKIGKCVTVFFFVNLSAKGSLSGSIAIGGLPYVANGFSSSGVLWSTTATNWVNIISFISAGQSFLYLRGATAAGITNNTSLTPADITATTLFSGSLTYYTP